MIIVTREEPFYTPVYLSKLFKKRHKEIIHVYINKTASPFLTKGQIFKMSSPASFFLMCLIWLQYKIFSIINISNGSKFYSVEQMARFYRIPYSAIDKSGLNQLAQKAIETKPILLLSVANSLIIPPRILDHFSQGGINIHGSLLPEYRGILAYFWALYYKEEWTGVTAHKMEKEVDTGAIIEQAKIKIEPNETVHSLLIKISQRGSTVLLNAVNKVLNHEETLPQSVLSKEEFPLFHRPSEEQLTEFSRSKRFF